MQQVLGAAEEIAAAMGLGDVRVVGSIPPRVDLPGAYLPIVGVRGPSMYIGWLASPDGCEALAKALLGHPAEGRIPPSEVMDAMGEIVNMVAGAFKRRMAFHNDAFILGLPVFAASHIRPLAGRALATEITCGHVSSVLIVMGNADDAHARAAAVPSAAWDKR